MSQPLVTVACPVYGHEAFVKQCLDAVAAQTIGGANIQLIIVEDQSPDGSAQAVEQWLAEGKMPDVTFIQHNQNRGLWYGLNEAYQQAVGRYFCISSGDDFMHPHMLQDLSNALELAGPETACAFADHNYVDLNGQITGHTMLGHRYANKADIPQGKILSQSIWQAPFVTQAAMFRVDAMRAIGHRYRPEIICEDWDLILQLAAHGHSFVHVDSVVASYRTDPAMPSMLRSYNQRAKRNRMHASIMRMTLDVLKVPGLTETDQRQLVAKCTDAARQAMYNPGYHPLIGTQLTELKTYDCFQASGSILLCYSLRVPTILSTLASISDGLASALTSFQSLITRAKEKAALTVKRAFAR